MQVVYNTTMSIFCLENENILDHVALIFSRLILAKANYNPKGHAKFLAVKNDVLEAYCKKEKKTLSALLYAC